MPFRDIDPERAAQTERERAACADEDARAERELLHATKGRWRVPTAAAVAAALALGAPSVAWTLVQGSRSLAGPAFCVTCAGLLFALAAVVLGILTARKRVKRARGLLAIVCGVVAIPWALFVALVCLLKDGNLLG